MKFSIKIEGGGVVWEEGVVGGGERGGGGEQPKGWNSVKRARMPDFFYCLECKADLALF